MYSQQDYKDAIPYLKSAAEVVDADVVLRDRLIESYLKTQQFEEGRRELAVLREMGGRPYELAMLEAFLSEREAALQGPEAMLLQSSWQSTDIGNSYATR